MSSSQTRYGVVFVHVQRWLGVRGGLLVARAGVCGSGTGRKGTSVGRCNQISAFKASLSGAGCSVSPWLSAVWAPWYREDIAGVSTGCALWDVCIPDQSDGL